MLKRFVVRGLVRLIRVYQVYISPLKWPCCRFTPTCSQYGIEAIRKYGPIGGIWRTAWRILRCNPWCKGGHDPP